LFVVYLPKDSRKRSKHVAGLAHVCVSYLTIVQLLVHVWGYYNVTYVSEVQSVRKVAVHLRYGTYGTAIQERVTAVLRSIPKEAFVDSFQKLYERCQPCVVNDGDYFEGQ
jgi:hypothetical protein